MNQFKTFVLSLSIILLVGSLSAQSASSTNTSSKDTLNVKKKVVVFSNKKGKSGKKKVRTYQFTTSDTISGKDSKGTLKSKKIVISMAGDSSISMEGDSVIMNGSFCHKTPHCFKFEFDGDDDRSFNGFSMAPCMPGMPGDFEIEEFEETEGEEMPHNHMAFHFDPFMSDTALAMIMSFPEIGNMDTTFINEYGDTVQIMKGLQFNMPPTPKFSDNPRNNFMWRGDRNPHARIHNYYRPGSGATISDLTNEELTRLKKSELKPTKSYSPLGLERLEARFNHFGDKLSISFDYPFGEKLTVKLFNENGKQFYHEEILQSTGGYERKIQLPEDMGEMVYLRITSGKQSIVKRIDR